LRYDSHTIQLPTESVHPWVLVYSQICTMFLLPIFTLRMFLSHSFVGVLYKFWMLILFWGQLTYPSSSLLSLCGCLLPDGSYQFQGSRVYSSSLASVLCVLFWEALSTH
jgi:hypothetical protein